MPDIFINMVSITVTTQYIYNVSNIIDTIVIVIITECYNFLGTVLYLIQYLDLLL